MGLLKGTTHKEYYESSHFGNYQFTSLEEIIAQFQIAYVGEDKIISKIQRADIVFHAMRALQEFSFDTFKSIKAQQIALPPTLIMPLPHDYVNYTKISWVDSSGIKHPLYLTNSTSNPFQIRQEDNGDYSFPQLVTDGGIVQNGGFGIDPTSNDGSWTRNAIPSNQGTEIAKYAGDDGKLEFFHGTRNSHVGSNVAPWGHVMAAWQELDVSGRDYLDLSALGQAVDATQASVQTGTAVLRVGLSTQAPDEATGNPPTGSNFSNSQISTNMKKEKFDLFDTQNNRSYVEWSSADGAVSKSMESINVADHDVIYVVIVSYQEVTTPTNTTVTEIGADALSNVDDVSVIDSGFNKYLSSPDGNETESSTWQSYKSTTPSENNNDDYEDDTYWPMHGERYGLDPQHAQANGSFYIDNRIGNIHFSSNISGKTVILDYISDSLGTDGEMQVHKFAEEAIYKWIAYAILSTRANTPEYLVQRFKKERFAETRKAKLRLSSIKIEELTQILRGKSKQIKH
tara:strand:- start:5383 stop:6921 length:1539 start_codon:yes stop_codon:yes gene_type:complete